MNISEIAKELGLREGTVFNKSRTKDFEGWLGDKRWLLRNGLGRNCKVFRRGDKRCASPIIIDQVGIGTSSSSDRLQSWSEGKIDEDELFRPPDPNKQLTSDDLPNWEGMTGEKRTHKLTQIPSPTKYDLLYAGRV